MVPAPCTTSPPGVALRQLTGPFAAAEHVASAAGHAMASLYTYRSVTRAFPSDPRSNSAPPAAETTAGVAPSREGLYTAQLEALGPEMRRVREAHRYQVAAVDALADVVDALAAGRGGGGAGGGDHARDSPNARIPTSVTSSTLLRLMDAVYCVDGGDRGGDPPTI